MSLIVSVSTDGGVPIRWLRTLAVEYVPSGSAWLPASEGQKCRHGGGGHGKFRSPTCRRPALVQELQLRKGKTRGEYTLAWALCEDHCGGRMVLDDGMVIEPVTNPLGNA